MSATVVHSLHSVLRQALLRIESSLGASTCGSGHSDGTRRSDEFTFPFIQNLLRDKAIETETETNDTGVEGAIAECNIEADASNVQLLTPVHPLQRPFSRTLAQSFIVWTDNGSPPVIPSVLPYVEDLTNEEMSRMSQYTHTVMSLVHNVQTTTDDATPPQGETLDKLVSECHTLLLQLNARGVMSCLGMRTTRGSVNFLPPSKQELISSFNCLHTAQTTAPATKAVQEGGGPSRSTVPSRDTVSVDGGNTETIERAGKSNVSPPTDSATPEGQCANSVRPPKKSKAKPSLLTVGARALSKHFHRGDQRWWGVLKGSETQKNAQAMDTLQRVLDHIVWANTHMLPHEVPVYEVRTAEGYGMRWSMQPQSRDASQSGPDTDVSDVDDTRRAGTIQGSETVAMDTVGLSPADVVQFRGFLEPQMADGHEKGWKH
eukprot:GFYU01005469.1.p1 GENE.GFYU01005469.1~~GFYU01005469.1.p1  ORF type:complete len:432 (+),score=50.28 GFYU01005469.1:42-1337(+)